MSVFFFEVIIMIFNEKLIMLKNNISAVFKTPELSDAEKMLDLIKTVSGETPYLARYKEDWDKTSVESEAKWIENNRNSQNDLVIACFIDNKAVGCCEISFLSGSKNYHRAGIGISVRKEYWNIGIGSAFFSEIISAAKAHENTEILELEFVEGNDRAKALYEKFGFYKASVKPDAYKLKNGTYQNLVYMQKLLKPGDKNE